MHSFHHSRGRIFFEVLCAFGMSASCALAWMQTYATAMLGAAAIAALYGLVHFFDIFRRAPVTTVEAAEPVVLPVEPSAEVVANLDVQEPQPEASVVSASPPKPRKKRAVKAKPAVEKATVAQPDPVEAAPIAPERVAPEPAEPAAIEPDPEPGYAPIAPLFEPEPFVRQQQRAAFGRKFGVR